MSETQSAVQVASYLIMMIPSIYFLYAVLKAVYYYFTVNDEDIL
jgi:hypothetical protein